MFFRLFLTLVFMLIAAAPPPARADIAFLGDSISTGGAAHPGLKMDATRLAAIFSGQDSLATTPDIEKTLAEGGFAEALKGEKLRRLAPSRREFEGGLSWVARHTLMGLSHLYLDAEELSWSYLFGRAQGTPAKELLLAAEDGARMIHAPRQADRVLDATGGVLPSAIFIFFTGNDLCGPNLSYVTEAKTYGDQLEKTIRYLARNGRARPEGTDIYVMNPISVLQLVQSEEILNKKVFAHGQTMTCRELQTKQFKPTPLAVTGAPEVLSVLQFFPQSPLDYCPTVFAPSNQEGGREQQIALANRIHSYRREIGSRLKGIGSLKGIRLRQIHETGGLLFTPEEIAEDCFHLSYKGQMRVAQTVMKEIKGTGLQARSQ